MVVEEVLGLGGGGGAGFPLRHTRCFLYPQKPKRNKPRRGVPPPAMRHKAFASWLLYFFVFCCFFFWSFVVLCISVRGQAFLMFPL